MSHQAYPIAMIASTVPVTIDEDKCIAHKGCTVCVDVCPLMAFDECWYCMPCEKDCPTGAVHVDIPYLLR
jgi:NAD-dependent dihydropyrimidine dehydrogenase PreA subunit